MTERVDADGNADPEGREFDVPTDRRGATRRGKTSAWPIAIALGAGLSEVGIFLGVYPFAVGGLLLLASSVAGILVESNYAETVWPPIAGLGALFVVAGGLLVASQVDLATFDFLAAVQAPSGFVGRGLAVVGAGGIAFAAGVVGWLGDRV